MTDDALICPVCHKDGHAWLRCYRPDCSDGRGLIQRGNPLQAELNGANELLSKQADAIRTLTATLAAVEAERDALRGALAEAADDIEAWGAYASAYFQSKHGLLDCIAKYRALTQEKPA